MTRLILLASIALTVWADNREMYLLDAGVSTMSIVDSVSGNVATVPLPSATRLRVWFSYPELPRKATVNACPAPCSVTFNRQAGQRGDIHYWYEKLDASGNPLSPVQVSAMHTIAGVQPTPAACTFPIEVIGSDGYTKACQFTIAGGTNLSDTTLRLYLKAHALDYNDKLAYQWNSGTWTNITRSNVTYVVPSQQAYGGMGSGQRTLRVTVPVSGADLTTGTNVLRLRFLRSQGVSSGLRILDLNVWQDNGTEIIDDSGYTQENPNLWTAPNADDADEGETLWETADLLDPGFPGSTIQAKCADCHTRDGRDLKYFNFSNHVIATRTLFHGVPYEDGLKIASYIRSLPYPNPGRPWNPPYQPGPGLDAQPVTSWAAGAGIDAVYDSDADLYPDLLAMSFDADENLNVRQQRVPYQFPDWNHWLPKIHPKDGFANFAYNPAIGGGCTGDSGKTATVWANETFEDWYEASRDDLDGTSANGAAYAAALEELNAMGGSLFGAKCAISLMVAASPTTHSLETTRALYSFGLLYLVKTWEIMQEFGLEGIPTGAIPTHNEPRAWAHVGGIFDVSPNLAQIGPDNLRVQGVMHDDSMPASPAAVTQAYLSMVWYQVQMSVNNNTGAQGFQRPQDWGYVYGFHNNLTGTHGIPQGASLLLWQVKALQTMHDNGGGPEEYNSKGWGFQGTSPAEVAVPGVLAYFQNTDSTTRNTLLTKYLQAWYDEFITFDPEQFWASNQASNVQVLNPLNMNQNRGSGILWSLPQLKCFGVSTTLLGNIADAMKPVWPASGNAAILDSAKTASCTPNGLAHCQCVGFQN